MDESQVLRVLGKVGVVIADSHIVYTSGKHSTAYVNTDVGKGREFLARKQA